MASSGAAPQFNSHERGPAAGVSGLSRKRASTPVRRNDPRVWAKITVFGPGFSPGGLKQGPEPLQPVGGDPDVVLKADHQLAPAVAQGLVVGLVEVPEIAVDDRRTDVAKPVVADVCRNLGVPPVVQLVAQDPLEVLEGWRRSVST